MCCKYLLDDISLTNDVLEPEMGVIDSDSVYGACDYVLATVCAPATATGKLSHAAVNTLQLIYQVNIHLL